MLTINISTGELFDEKTEVFFEVNVTVDFEHSLVSMSKWESKFCRPFLNTEKSTEEVISYIQMMVITPNVSPKSLEYLSVDNLKTLTAYINDKQTATTIKRGPQKSISRETITSELIYYWMVALNIPFECQHWHLNRLLTLIEICNIKNQPQKKMSRGEQARQMRELNAQRRSQMGTSG